MSTRTLARVTVGQRLDKGLAVIDKSGRLYFKSTIYSKHFPNGEKAELWPVETLTVTEAKAKHEARRVEVRGLRGAVTDQTLRFAMEQTVAYIRSEAQRKGLNETYAKTIELNFAKHVEPFGIADLKLSKFDESTALNFLRYLRASGLTGGSQLAILNAVRRPLRHAREQGWMSRQYDPFKGHPRDEYPRHEDKDLPVLDDEQAASFIRAALSPEFRALSATDYSNAVLVNMLEGDRVSETIGRCWNDVDFETHEISINGQAAADLSGQRVQTKNRKTRTKHMHDLTHAALVRQRQIEWSRSLGRANDPLFTKTDGTPVNRWDLLRAVKRAARLAGLGHITPRDLRRSLCTAMHHSGIAGAEAAGETGHTLETWTRYYAKRRNTQAQRVTNHDAMKKTGYGYIEEAL